MDYTVTANTGSYRELLLWILSIVCYWFILTKKGEAGWKGIFPVWREYALANAIGETRLAKRILITGIASFLSVAVIIFIALLLGFTAVVGIGGILLEIDDVIGALLAGSALSLMLVCLAALVILVVFLVSYFQLCWRFTLYEGASGLWMLSWIFMPAIALVYFAFFSQQREGF